VVIQNLALSRAHRFFPAEKNQIRTLPMILFGYPIAALAATQ